MINKLFLICLCLWFVFSTPCSQVRNDRLKKEGDKMVKQVEEFKQQKGRLPDSVKELGMEETLEGPIYYRKIDENRYMLWFGTELGESIKYDSDRRTWK